MIPLRRLGAALLAGVAISLALLLATAAPAAAHSQVIASTPADGQRLETSPTALTFVLSEPSDPASVVVGITGSTGPLDVLGTPTEAAVSDIGRQTIAVPVTKPLPAGLYRVTFAATSRVDGHTASSQLIFGVRTDVAAPIGDEASTSGGPLDRVRSGLEGITLLASGIAFGLLVLGPVGAGRGRRAALVASLVALAAALLGGLVWHTGNGVVVAGAGALGALWLVLQSPRPAVPGRIGTVLPALALVVAVAPLALVGHAAVQGAGMTLLAVLHVVTTAAWSGTVVAAALLLVRSDRNGRLALLRRTSAVAGATFLIALLSGLLMANGLVPSVGALTGSWYGWGLIAKSVLVVPILLLALLVRERLRGGRSGSVTLEAVLLTVVAVLGILVASQPPPAAAKFAPTPSWTADTAAVGVSADDLLINVLIDPNTPGSRFLVVRVDSTRRPAPGAVTGVTASFADGPLLTLKRGDDGSWTSPVDVTAAGPTPVHVEVSRTGLPVSVANTTWTVAAAPGTLTGGASLTGYLTVIIGGLLVALLLVLLVEGFGGRRRPRPDDGSDEGPDNGPDDGIGASPDGVHAGSV